MPAGYSQRSLVDGLDSKRGMRAHFVALEKDVERELGALPEDTGRATSLRGEFDDVLAFTAKRAELPKLAVRCGRALVPTGMLWVSWPNQSLGVPCDFAETYDVKFCAGSEVRSGLKLVISVEDRPGGGRIPYWTERGVAT